MLPQPCVYRREGGIISQDKLRQALDLIDTGPDSPCCTIGDGVYCEIATNIFLYIHWGPVGIHSDDAGMTYGYVIKGGEGDTGLFELRVAGACDQLEPLGRLETDSAFVINSNHDHDVVMDDGDLLIFITQDFDNEHGVRPASPRPPSLSLAQWLTNLPGLFDAWLERAKTIPLSPYLLQGEDHV